MPKSKSPPTETCNAINKSGKNKDKQCLNPSKHSITYNDEEYEVCGRHKKATNFINKSNSKTIDDTEEIIKRNPNADIVDESEYQDENKSSKPPSKEEIEEIISSDDEEESCDDDSSDSDTDSDNISDDDLKVDDEYIRPEFNESDDELPEVECIELKTKSKKHPNVYLNKDTNEAFEKDNKTRDEALLLGHLIQVNDKKSPIKYNKKRWIISSNQPILVKKPKIACFRCVLTNRVYVLGNYGIYDFYGFAKLNKKGKYYVSKVVTES
jgi:hypothetical protein